MINWQIHLSWKHVCFDIEVGEAAADVAGAALVAEEDMAADEVVDEVVSKAARKLDLEPGQINWSSNTMVMPSRRSPESDHLKPPSVLYLWVDYGTNFKE